VADPENDDENVKGIRRFFAAVASEPRVSPTVLQTVGEKATTAGWLPSSTDRQNENRAWSWIVRGA
jgi:hypothetical protein